MSSAGLAFLDLGEFLKSNMVTVPREEVNLYLECESQATKDGLFGFLFGYTIPFVATAQLNHAFHVGLSKVAKRLPPAFRVVLAEDAKLIVDAYRFSLSAGAALVYGACRMVWSLESSVDRLLALPGSQMQKELANILVRNYQHNPVTMRLMAKHFYSEQVFDDSSSDEPKFRWRYRNFFSDGVAYGQHANDTDSDGQISQHSRSCDRSADKSSYNDPRDNSKINSVDLKNYPDKRRVDSNRISADHGVDMMGDPIDCIFGGILTKEEIPHQLTSNGSSKAPNQVHRRSRRRHRMPHLEFSSDTSFGDA